LIKKSFSCNVKQYFNLNILIPIYRFTFAKKVIRLMTVVPFMNKLHSWWWWWWWWWWYYYYYYCCCCCCCCCVHCLLNALSWQCMDCLTTLCHCIGL